MLANSKAEDQGRILFWLSLHAKHEAVHNSGLTFLNSGLPVEGVCNTLAASCSLHVTPDHMDSSQLVMARARDFKPL